MTIDMIRKIFFLMIIKPLLELFMGLRVFGRENLTEKRPFILIANHSSHLDVAVLLNLFNFKEISLIKPLAAADYFTKNKIVHFLTKTLFNILPIPRKRITQHNNPIEIMKNALNKNESLIIFPEGTRSLDGKLSEFKTGLAHLIQIYPSVPVVPVYISNLWRCLPKGEFIPLPFFIDVIIGKEIYPTGNKEEITSFLYEEMSRLKKNLEDIK